MGLDPFLVIQPVRALTGRAGSDREEPVASLLTYTPDEFGRSEVRGGIRKAFYRKVEEVRRSASMRAQSLSEILLPLNDVD
jgi:hypothetical protein